MSRFSFVGHRVRVLHDAAATGRALPETGNPPGPDATPVTVQDLARTVLENYASRWKDQGRLEALQGGKVFCCGLVIAELLELH